MDLKRQADQQLQRADFIKYELPDITGISLPNAGPQAKARAFLRAAGNPYLFRVGDIGVHVAFSGETGDTLQDRMCRLLSKSI